MNKVPWLINQVSLLSICNCAEVQITRAYVNQWYHLDSSQICMNPMFTMYNWVAFCFTPASPFTPHHYEFNMKLPFEYQSTKRNRQVWICNANLHYSIIVKRNCKKYLCIQVTVFPDRARGRGVNTKGHIRYSSPW